MLISVYSADEIDLRIALCLLYSGLVGNGRVG